MLDMHKTVFILDMNQQTSDIQVGTPRCFSTGAGGNTGVQPQIRDLRKKDYIIINAQTSSI